MTGEELVVFGRTEYAEPLSECGEAATGEDVLAILPGPWVELVTIPRSRNPLDHSRRRGCRE